MPVRRGLSATVAAAAVLAAAAATGTAQESPSTPLVAVSPARPHAGTPLTVDVRATTSTSVRVCLLPSAGASRCELATEAGDGTHRATFTAPYAGRWTVVADAGPERATRRLRVLPRGNRLVVLAAGDSLVQNLAHGLAGRLHLRRGVVLHRDIEMGRGLSKPDGFDWLADAEDAVARWAPDVVVVFLGGNEGYTMDGAVCCADEWVRRFAQRQRALMRAYAGDGSTRVYWTRLPAPGPGLAARRIVWAAENLALLTATAQDDARVFDANAVLTPGYRWRRAMPWHGRRRVVREDDGVHLNRTGGRVAAWALLRQLRADEVLLAEPITRSGTGRNVPRPTRTRP